MDAFLSFARLQHSDEKFAYNGVLRRVLDHSASERVSPQQVVASSYLMKQGAANVTGVQIQQVTNAYTVQVLLQDIPVVAPNISRLVAWLLLHQRLIY